MEQLRITPARAGKTRLSPSRFLCASDHPRACGENLVHYTDSVVCLGSPPRVRGKRCS